MREVIEVIRKQKDVIVKTGVSLDAIQQAEDKLGLEFSSEYKEYLSEFGLAMFGQHELTGLSNAKRLDVVSITEKQRELLPQLKNDMYIIEEANIDGVVYAQEKTGRIYQLMPGQETIIVSASLVDYIKSTI